MLLVIRQGSLSCRQFQRRRQGMTGCKHGAIKQDEHLTATSCCLSCCCRACSLMRDESASCCCCCMRSWSIRSWVRLLLTNYNNEINARTDGTASDTPWIHTSPVQLWDCVLSPVARERPAWTSQSCYWETSSARRQGCWTRDSRDLSDDGR